MQAAWAKVGGVTQIPDKILTRSSGVGPSVAVQVDGYQGSIVGSVSLPRVSQSSSQSIPPNQSGLADTSAATALFSCPSIVTGLLGKLKGLGLSIRDWATGEAGKQRQAHQVTQGVLALAESMKGLTDQQLQAKTTEFRALLQSGKSLDDIQVQAYAVAREAARRVSGLTANDKQVLGAAYAHQGSIVDMKTGEGKTLMEVMPAYLHALTGNGVHVITANDYLAGRDRSTMGPIFEKLGLSASVVARGLSPGARKAANQSDITYGTASEFAFQYLTDHLTLDPNARVSRDLSKVYALVDEADKVLLDDANTPLVISDSLPDNPRPTQVMAAVVKHLQQGSDYEVDLKDRAAWLTEPGLVRAEKLLGMGNLYTKKNEELIPYLHTAVMARALFHEGIHYLKQGNEIVLVDEFTGRPKPGHRFAEGLHQAIEAAEGITPGDSQLTLASVTYPNYLRMYGTLAGMTGTGLSADKEFSEVFGLPVRGVAPHKPVMRKDLGDVMFGTAGARDAALADHVAELHRQGRPVLLGTKSIERSEDFSRMLADRGIPHKVLNAKNLEAEADIVAQAGRLGAVTIATNMAGRGTDIKLGGDPELLARQGADLMQQCANEKAQVIGLGGLAVLGSERHEARRIDEQLAGRAGRQGDPGTSQFWLSREDELFRLHTEDPQKSKLAVVDLVAQAQEHAEGKSLEMRKDVLKYDGVVNLQRKAVYGARDAVLDGADMSDEVPGFIDKVVKDLEMRQRTEAVGPAEVQQEVSYLLGRPGEAIEIPQQGLAKWLKSEITEQIGAQRERMGLAYTKVLGAVYTSSLDREWMEQLSTLESIRQGNGWEAGQEENPLIHYETKAYGAFEVMLERVAARTIHGLLAARPIPPPPAQ